MSAVHKLEQLSSECLLEIHVNGSLFCFLFDQVLPQPILCSCQLGVFLLFFLLYDLRFVYLYFSSNFRLLKRIQYSFNTLITIFVIQTVRVHSLHLSFDLLLQPVLLFILLYHQFWWSLPFICFNSFNWMEVVFNRFGVKYDDSRQTKSAGNYD